MTKRDDSLHHGSDLDIAERCLVMAAHDVAGEKFDQRAASVLAVEPEILRSLIGIREHGRVEMSLGTVRMLCVLGLLTADENGYFLPDVVEDALDDLIDRLKKEGKTLDGLSTRGGGDE